MHILTHRNHPARLLIFFWLLRIVSCCNPIKPPCRQSWPRCSSSSSALKPRKSLRLPVVSVITERGGCAHKQTHASVLSDCCFFFCFDISCSKQHYHCRERIGRHANGPLHEPSISCARTRPGSQMTLALVLMLQHLLMLQH